MAKLVVHGAILQCDQGIAPSTLVVPPSAKADATGASLATIAHHMPHANIVPFGMCRSMANPTVQAATAAAQGVLTPTPCVPNTSTPWSGASTRADVDGYALLTENSTCSCMWAGTVSILSTGTEAEVGA